MFLFQDNEAKSMPNLFAVKYTCISCANVKPKRKKCQIIGDKCQMVILQSEHHTLSSI